MNAGKSTTLLQASYNYQERGMKTILLSPRFDLRSGPGRIASRIGLEASSYPFGCEDDLFAIVERLHIEESRHCVLVDEAHFLQKVQVLQLARVCDDLKIPVLAYGLRSDFLANPFEGSQYLLALADEIIEIKTICHCGRKATMNMRIDASGAKVTSGAQIEFGGNERYVATCRQHFFAGVAVRSASQRNEHVLPSCSPAPDLATH